MRNKALGDGFVFVWLVVFVFWGFFSLMIKIFKMKQSNMR